MAGSKPVRIPRPNDLPDAVTFAPEDWSVAWKAGDKPKDKVYRWKNAPVVVKRPSAKLSDILKKKK